MRGERHKERERRKERERHTERGGSCKRLTVPRHPVDGDRVQVPLGDPTIELLPPEWSEHVEKKQKWGWWGYNKDRAQVAQTKEGVDGTGEWWSTFEYGMLTSRVCLRRVSG